MVVSEQNPLSFCLSPAFSRKVKLTPMCSLQSACRNAATSPRGSGASAGASSGSTCPAWDTPTDSSESLDPSSDRWLTLALPMIAYSSSVMSNLEWT